MFKKLLSTLHYDRLPSLFRNVFFLSIVSFTVWMLFFDDNNLIKQYRLLKELSEIEKKKEFYRVEAKRVSEEYNAIMNDDEYALRYAREKYWMKRSNEDVYIVLESEKKENE